MLPFNSGMPTGDFETYDVIIIGAGPCGLATAARLREQRPSALFTDEEHARFSWISNRASVKNRRNGQVKARGCNVPQPCGPSILVLDESGDQWMSKWKTLFCKLEISHLRSPMFFHPDPSDRDALLAFCHEHERMAEMQEITGCVGKEVSKHHRRKSRTKGQPVCAKAAIEINERDRRDYFTPSSGCFHDFCDACVNKYSLTQHLIRQEVVEEVKYQALPSARGNEPVFHIRTGTSRYLSRAVVLAIGAGEPMIPSPFPSQLPTSASHVSDASLPTLLSKQLHSRIRSGKTTSVLVIGGGLTSAQTVDACIRHGIDKVYMLMRGHWKVKQFDVDLSWMSKFRNHQRSTFWNADGFEERLCLIQGARGGGSMTSRASKLLKHHILKGKAVVHTNTILSSQIFDDVSKSWNITTEPPIPDLPSFDHIFFATGTKTDITSMSMLQKQLMNHPIETIAGLPVLNTNLAWSDDIPLFIAGKMAMLQLGPGAGNLEGARESAERITWAIENLLQRRSIEMSGALTGIEEDDDVDSYAMGIGNKFARLSCHM